MNIISRKVEEILHKYGEQYFEGFKEKEFTKALFAGDLTARNLTIRPEALNDNKIPFNIVSGHIDEMVLMIPWANIFNEAVIIKISGIDIRLETKSIEDVIISKEQEFKTILQEVIAVAKNEFLVQMGNQGSILDFWMVKNLIDRIIDNVQIQIRNVHIEVDHAEVKPPFTIELLLKDLELYTTDQSFMNRQFTKAALATDESGVKKQIFKVLNLSNLLINIKPTESQDSKKRKKAYEDQAKYNIFRVSLSVRVIKNAEHQELDPDYEASVKFNQNEITLTHWQIQRILNLMDFIKKLNERLDNLRNSFKYHPERRIAEFFRVNPGTNPEIIAKYNRLKEVATTNWWKYAILEVVKAGNKSRKKEIKGKFYGLVASMNIDKLLDYEVPGVMLDVYTDDFNHYMEDLAKNDFDLEKFHQDELMMHSLRSLVFIIPLRVQKMLAKKFGKDYAAKVKERQKNSWTNLALSFIPFFGEPGLTKDQKEIKDLLQGELGKDKKKFSKFILKLSLEVKKGAYTLLNDENREIANRFGFYANSFAIDLKLYDGKMEASVDLKDFEFLFSKSDLRKNRIDFPVIKSTTDSGTSFLNAKFLSVKTKTKTSISIDVYIQHVDVIFVNSVISDLIGFFQIQQYDAEVASEALEGLGKFSNQNATEARRAINNSSLEIAIMVNVLSPRVLVPMTKELDNLNNETNLFVFYLGDIVFVHNIRSGAMNSLGTVFNVKLNHVKLEYWEDYDKAVKMLNIAARDEFEDTQEIELVRNFIMLDLVAVVKYTGSNDGKAHNVSVLLENFDLRINPYTFHQLYNVQKLVDFSKELTASVEKRIQDRTNKSAIAVLEKSLPCKKKLEEKYQVKHIIFTKNHVYIYKDKQSFAPETSYTLTGYALYVAEDMKTKGYILKLWKGNVILSIAFRTFDEVKEWVNRLIEVCPELTVRSVTQRDKDELPFVINLDLIIKRVEIWMYNEIFERNTLLAMKYVEVRVAKDKMLKVKLSLDSLVVENFEKSFSVRGIKTLAWIGSTQWPSRNERKLYKRKDDLATKATKIRESQFSELPGPASLSMGPESLDITTTMNDDLHSLSAVAVAKLQADHDGVEGHKRAIGESVRLRDTSASNVKFGKDVEGRVNKNIAAWSGKGTIRNTPDGEYGMVDHGAKNQNFDEDHERRHKKEMENLRRIDEGFILYFEQTDKNLMDIDLHIVNVTATWDTDYIQSLEKRVSDFIKIDPAKNQEADKPDPNASQVTKKKRKIDPSTVKEELKMRAQVKVDRSCIICRTKNMNVSDMVVVDIKVVFTQFVKRMLVNIYIKRFALRDLTGYPFTKKPDQLKDYRRQTKNLLASVIETSKDTNVDNLDNNGVIVVVEVIGPDFLPENRIGTKAEVILNNAETNFFLQPVLRFVDFILVQMLGYLIPDDSAKLSNDQIVKNASEITKLSMNIFLRNTRVNLIPNYYVDKCLILDLPIIAVLNEQYEDTTRLKAPYPLMIPVMSQNVTVEIRGGYLRGLLRGMNAFEVKTLTITIDMLIGGGNFERLYGRIDCEKLVEKRNKIIVAVEELDINFRRDEFYALMAWVFCSLSYNDFMDEYFLVSMPNLDVPALPQDIRILLNPVSANFSDDGGNEFLCINFTVFYVDIKMTSDRRQLINVFGKGLDSDVVTSRGAEGETRPLFPFIKELQQMEIFSHGNFGNGGSESYIRRNKTKTDKKYASITLRKEFNDQKTVAEKLHETVLLLEAESEANFYVEIIQKVAGEGQIINVTLKKLGINALLPAIMAVVEIVTIVDEMNMNYMIRPKLKKDFGIQNTTINIEDVFLFLMSPRGRDLSIVLHVQELSIFTGTEPKEKDFIINNELVHFFDPKEFSGDELFQQLNTYNPAKLIQVSQTSVALNNAYMDFVPTSKLMMYIKARVARDSTLGISRNIMQPTFLAYQSRDYQFKDNYNEMTFTRGVAHAGALNLLINTDFIDYLLSWQLESSLQHIASMQFKGVYDAHIKTVLKKTEIPISPVINKVKKLNLDLIVQGIVVTLIDDIYNTNLPMIHLTVMPLSVNQIQNSDYTGFKDINVTLEFSVFNYNSQEWEPVLENFTVIIESFKDGTEDKVNRTNISFADRNPAINVSTELGVIAMSILNKMSQKPTPREANAFKRAIQQVAMKSMTTRSGAPPTYDSLAVLDKEKMLGFINQFGQSPYARQSMMKSLDNTKLYGYDDMVRSNYPINNILLNKINFEEKAALLPKNPLNYRHNEHLPQGGHLNIRESQMMNSLAQSGYMPQVGEQPGYGANAMAGPQGAPYQSILMDSMSMSQSQMVMPYNNNPLQGNLFQNQGQGYPGMMQQQGRGVAIGRTPQGGISIGNLQGQMNPYGSQQGNFGAIQGQMNPYGVQQSNYGNMGGYSPQMQQMMTSSYMGPVGQGYNTQSMRGSQSSIIGVPQDQGPENFTPQRVQELQFEADKKSDTQYDEIYLREIPYRVENFTGRDIIFSLTFCDMPKQIYVRNLEFKDLEYPFTLENTLLQRKLLKSRQGHVKFRVYEVDENKQTFIIHQGSDLYSLRRLKIPYSMQQGPGQDLRYIIMEIDPMIMKKNIQFKSSIQLVNKCRHHIQAHFSRNGKKIYTMQAIEDNILPVPVDLLDTVVALDISNISKKIDTVVPAINLWGAEKDSVQAYTSNEMFTVSLYTDQDENCKYIYITPPLILKNMLLTNVSLQMYRKAMGREYNDTYELPFEQDDLEVYEVSCLEGSKLNFRVEANGFISETIKIGLDDARIAEMTGNFWMYLEGKKKFSVNYNIFFLKGSYVLTFFVEHILFDDLFRRVVYAQRGSGFDDNLTTIDLLDRNTQVSRYKSSIWAAPSANTSMLQPGSERELHRSRIYLVPIPKGEVWLSDQKDIYEMVSIKTNKHGEKEYTTRAINPITNAIEVYDIVVANEVYKLANQPVLFINKTHVRHKYLLNNQTDHEVQIVQLEYPNSVEKVVKPGSIKPVHFSPDDTSNSQIQINKPSMYYFMIRNVIDQTQNMVEGIMVERFVTISLQITYIWKSTHLLTIRREPEMGAFKIVNNLDDVILFISQDPFKLQNNVAEVALRPNTWAYYSWPSTFSKKRDLFMMGFSVSKAVKSEIYQIDYKQRGRAYDIFGNRIFHSANMSGATLVLNFSEILDQTEKRKLESVVNVIVPYMGISVIAGRNEHRRELLYVSLLETSFNQQIYDRITKMYLKMKFLNIDNTSEYLAHYPIFFTPKFSYDNIRANDWNHIDLYIKQVNKDKDSFMVSPMTVYNKIDLKLISNILMIEESWLHYTLNAADDAMRQLDVMDILMNKKRSRTLIVNPELTRDYKQDLLRQASQNYWNLPPKDIQPSATYINELAISDHEISVSLRRERKDDPRAAFNRFSAMLQSYGFKWVPSIEDLEIGFKQFYLENGLYGTEAVTDALVHQYRNNAIRTAIPSLLKFKSLTGAPKILSKGQSSTMRSTLTKQPRGYNESMSVIGLGKSATPSPGFSAMAPYNGSFANQRSMQASQVMSQMNYSLSQMGSSKFGAKLALEKPFEMGLPETDPDPTFLGSVRQSFAGFASNIARPFKNLFTTTNQQRKKIEREIEEDVAKEVEIKSMDRFDKLINYTQVNDGNPNTYMLLINTVAYIYCMDPLDKRVVWRADKVVPVSVQQLGGLALQFSFRDSLSGVNGSQVVNFYSQEDMEEFYNSVVYRR